MRFYIYITLKYTFSAILGSIRNDFGTYLSRERIGQVLPFEILTLMFKSDDLDVDTEDDLLKVFTTWYDFEIRSDSEVDQLINLIRWRFVSMTKFLDMVSGESVSITIDRKNLCNNLSVCRLYREELKNRLM
jgi:hypothetical protein